MKNKLFLRAFIILMKIEKQYVDRFRSRIIFPVKSLNGSVFALGGRTLSKTNFAKYINSPETEFYKKGNNLYNINSAKEFRDKDNESFYS